MVRNGSGVPVGAGNVAENPELPIAQLRDHRQVAQARIRLLIRNQQSKRKPIDERHDRCAISDLEIWRYIHAPLERSRPNRRFTIVEPALIAPGKKPEALTVQEVRNDVDHQR